MPDTNEIAPLDKVEFIRRRHTNTDARRIAYLQEGSYVRFLIDTHGREKFLSVFSGDGYEGVFGKNGADLETEWREFIARKKDSVNCGEVPSEKK